MGRNAKLDRLLTLVKALGESAEGLTLDEMAEVIGANRRTAERLRDLILGRFDHLRAQPVVDAEELPILLVSLWPFRGVSAPLIAERVIVRAIKLCTRELCLRGNQQPLDIFGQDPSKLFASILKLGDDGGVHFSEEPIAGVLECRIDLVLDRRFQSIELKFDLLWRAPLLDDLKNLLLEVDAAGKRAQDFVTGAEDAFEEVELLAQQLVNSLLGLVLQIEHVDHGDVDLLAVAMATSNPLLDPLRVPGQIEVHKQGAELEVDAFGTALGRDQDCFVVTFESLDDRRLHVGRL